MEIYTINTDFLLDENIYNRYLPLVSEYRRSKVNQLRFKEDKVLSLGAGLMLAYSLAKAGIDEKEVVYVKGEHGKPYIEGLNKFFSLSHSGHRAAFVLDASECGIDIEQIKPYKKQIVERMFSEEEKTVLFQYRKDEDLMDECFTRIWTRKESCGKFTGSGLNFTDDIQKRVINDNDMSARGIYFKEYRISEEKDEWDYILSVCSANSKVVDASIIDIKNTEEIFCAIHRNY